MSSSESGTKWTLAVILPCMLDTDLFDLIDPILKALGAKPEDGEEFRTPPLDILRYYVRPVRLHRLPILGRATSVLAVLRQPVDIGFSTSGYRNLLSRVAMAVNGRFPPWPRGAGLSIGLTLVVLTPEPIQPDDEATLQTSFVGLARMRSIPLGLIRLNLGQEAMAATIMNSPDDLFPEAERIAVALSERLRRFVPLWEG